MTCLFGAYELTIYIIDTIKLHFSCKFWNSNPLPRWTFDDRKKQDDMFQLFCSHLIDYPLGKITSQGRPEDIPKRRRMDVPICSLCNAKGRPLPTSCGQLLQTLWRYPHTVCYLTPRDVSYCLPENVTQVKLRNFQEIKTSVFGLSINKRYIIKMASTVQQVDDTKGQNLSYMC